MKEKHKIREASKFTRISANKPYMIGTIRKKHRWLLLIYLCAHSMSFAHTNTLYMSVRTSFEHSPYCTLHYLNSRLFSLYTNSLVTHPAKLPNGMHCTRFHLNKANDLLFLLLRWAPQSVRLVYVF